MSTSQLAGEALLRRVCASNAARRVFICYVSLMGLNKWLGGVNPCSVFFQPGAESQKEMLGARSLILSWAFLLPYPSVYTHSISPVNDGEFEAATTF